MSHKLRMPQVSAGEQVLNGYDEGVSKMAKSKTTPRGRNADNGRFTTVKKAENNRTTHIVERVPKPGYGDTDRGKK